MSRTAALENGRDGGASQTLAELIEIGIARRSFVVGLGSLAAGAATGTFGAGQARAAGSTLGFKEVPKALTETHHVPEGYTAQTLLRWGDAVTAGSPAFDPAALDAAAQEKLAGYNCDFIGYLPLPQGSGASDHGLLVVNHEYTDTGLMFPGINPEDIGAGMTAERVAVELAAHGLSIVEIKREGGQWAAVPDSAYNRRISLRSTEMMVSGPAQGHGRLKTVADPSGERVMGTINNCSGGISPWGTVLTAEENFHQYFSGDPAGTPEERNYKRVGIKGEPEYGWWAAHEARFDIAKEPNEPNRFGWVVEIDPYDAGSTPMKRTALGRFKHEAATTVVNPDGRVVVYTGDDERFEHLYKFVTEGTYDAANREANMGLLDAGTLYAAKFGDDGTVTWLPLTFGEGPLTPANGFESQADVVIEARQAAELLGATRMDRPEDVETNPKSGKVYVMLTNNTKREADQIDAANPRAKNAFGHVLEITPPGGTGAAADHAAETGTWTVFLLGGDPADPAAAAQYGEGVTADGWVADPDNCAFDPQGRLWIATDGAPTNAGHADGVFACDTDGPGRAVTRRFFSAPRGAEVCGPCFTPDGTTFFVAVQHPGEEDGSTFEAPTTRWPDFADGMPPRPTVLAVTKDDGGPIGS